MQYVYQAFEPGLWTVGFYDPSGKWHPESDHDKRDEAAARVNYLHGGPDVTWTTALQTWANNCPCLCNACDKFRETVTVE